MDRETQSKYLILKYIEDTSKNNDDEGKYLHIIASLKQIWNIQQIEYKNLPKLVDLVPEMGSDVILCGAMKALGSGKFDMSILSFSEAIAKNPSDSYLYSMRAAVYIKESKYIEAVGDSKMAIDLNRMNMDAYLRLGFALWSLNMISEARKAYGEGLQMFPNNETLMQALTFLGPEDPKKSLGIAAALSEIEKMKDTADFQELLKDEGIRILIEKLEKNPSEAYGMVGNSNFMRLMSFLIKKFESLPG